MKYLLLLFVAVISFTSCKKDLPEEIVNENIEEGILSAKLSPLPIPVQPYQWTDLPVPFMPGYPYNNPGYRNIVMNVNNSVYLLTAGEYERCYKLDNNTKQWYQAPTFGLFLAGYQYLFSYGEKIYSGLAPGFDFNGHYFFSINPENDSRQELATFPGLATSNQVSFVLGDKGYVISGHTNFNSAQIWEYNFATDEWTNKGNSPLGKRNEACVFVANNKVYMGLGYVLITLNGQTIKQYKKDWIEYIPGSAYGIAKADFPGTGRGKAKGFVINNMPHVGFGSRATTYYKDMWKYNPSNNTWTQQPDWPGTSTSSNGLNLSTFTIGKTGYVVTGALAEFWRYSNSLFYP